MWLVSQVVLLRAIGVGLAATALAAGPALGACWGGTGGDPAQDGNAESAVAGAAGTSGCGEATMPEMDETYVPYEQQRSHPAEYPVLGNKDSVTLAEARSAGYEALMPSDRKGLDEDVKLLGSGEFIVYLSREPISASDSYQDLMSAGAALIIESPVVADVEITERAKTALGKQATEVMIGPYRAVMNHGGEVRPGVRPYGLWWSDGRRDRSLRAAWDDPRDVIEMARSMVCD